MRTLRTTNLVLDPVSIENCAVLWRVMQAAHLREFQDVPRYTREEFERRVAGRAKRLDARALGRFEWIVRVARTGEAAGWVSLRVGDLARGSGEIGYSVLLPFRGHGYAAEASRAIVDESFASASLARVEACCVPANEASRRLLRGLGFEELRVQRHGAMVRGRPVDIVLFELRRETWQRVSTVVPAPSSRAGDVSP